MQKHILAVSLLSACCSAQVSDSANVVNVEPHPDKNSMVLTIANNSKKPIVAYSLVIDKTFADGIQESGRYDKDKGPDQEPLAVNGFEKESVYGSFSGNPLSVVKAQVAAVFYSDGTAEVFSPEGVDGLKNIAVVRYRFQTTYQQIANTIRASLATKAEHPMQQCNAALREYLFNETMTHRPIDTEKIDLGLMADIVERLDKKYLAGQSERDYMQALLTEQQNHADTYAKAKKYGVVNYRGAK